jgi:hypothetical protein
MTPSDARIETMAVVNKPVRSGASSVPFALRDPLRNFDKKRVGLGIHSVRQSFDAG